MASNSLSLQKYIHLCSIDQQNPSACLPRSCNNLHMCCDYLLDSKCSKFELNGKCSHSHSLFTIHNQKILQKCDLLAKDDETFQIVSRLIRTSLSNNEFKSKSSEEKLVNSERSSIFNDDREVESRNGQESTGRTGRDRGRQSQLLTPASSFLSDNQSHGSTTDSYSERSSSSAKPLSRIEKTLSIPRRLFQSLDTRVSQFKKKTDFSLTSKPDIIARGIYSTDDQSNQKLKMQPMLLSRRSLSTTEEEQKDKFTGKDRLSLINNIDDRADSLPMVTASSRTNISFMQLDLRDHGEKKEKSSSISNPDHSVRSKTQMKYIFNKQLKDDQLCYLLGPGRRCLIETDEYQIFPSGYCRLTNIDEEKQIEQRLSALLPSKLKTDPVRLPNDDLAFFISTSAAERLFEQNQMPCAIISEPATIQFSIEVIHAAASDRPRSHSTSARKILSSTLSLGRKKPQMSSSDGKFRIPSTDSSIDVISGDISKTSIDMMVCVSTSYTLLDSVLHQAGHSIASQYKEHSRLANDVLLDGGRTSARKILFIVWDLTVKPKDTITIQRSLSDLVKRCIDQAHQLHMKSISFPCIGTGQMGLDPHLICESMITAAKECLSKYKMDVVFVIYPSSEPNKKLDSYQMFRNYLNRQVEPTTTDMSSIPNVYQKSERREYIDRNVPCKRISTVSDWVDTSQYHKPLVKSLEKLIVEKIFNLSLIQPLYTDRIELLIDECLNYHVLPRIDFSKGELTLRGDLDSCSQCFANLQKERLIHKYNTLSNNGQDIKMNMYVSMKIDEAFAVGDSNIRIEDNNNTSYDIDLKNSKVRVNDDPQSITLYRTQLNANSKIVRPLSWSSSLLMTHTTKIPSSSFHSLECVYVFEQTMSKTEWLIERIDAIENYPLYVHYTRKKSKPEVLAFHGCPFSSVQSIIQYGLHSTHDEQTQNSIILTRDALNSHILGGRRSTDGKYYIFVVQIAKDIIDQDYIKLSNSDAHFALPRYLIVYQRQKDS